MISVTRTMWVALVLAMTACGGSQTSTTSTADDANAARAWSPSMLDKLDAPLRARVQHGEPQRIAIKVFFREVPGQDALSELLLSRVGDQGIGEVQLATLMAIAARPDVEHIEALTDVGYADESL